MKVPQDKAAAVRRAQELAHKGGSSGLEECHQLRQHFADEPQICQSLGDMYVKQQATKQAFEAYSQAAELYAQSGFMLKSFAIYKRMRRLEPGRRDLYTRLGDLYSDCGLTNNAIAEYLSGVKLLDQAGDSEAALALYRKILLLSPSNTSVRRRVADLCLETRRTEEAIQEYLRLAENLCELRRNDEARGVYALILKYAPGHPEATRRLGSLSFDSPETVRTERANPSPVDGGISALEVTMAEAGQQGEPRVVERTEDELQPLTATVEVEGQDLDEEIVIPGIEASSERAADEEIVAAAFSDETREQFERYYSLAVAYKDMGLLDEAIETFELASRGPFRFLDSCVMTADCYRERRLNNSAISWLQRALTDARCKGPLAAYVKYRLALLYEEEGFAKKAAQLYASIPASQEAADRLAKISPGPDSLTSIRQVG